MRIDDLGFYPSDGLNPSVPTVTTNPKRNLLFSFITLRQVDSQKLGIIEFIATLYSILQNVFISFWPHLDLSDSKIVNKHDYMRMPLDFEETLTSIFFFCSTKGSPQTIYIFSFVTFFATLLFFILSLSSFCLFFFKKQVNFPLLHCFNFFAQFVCPIVIVPIGFQAGWLISRISMMTDMKEEGISLDNYGSLTTFTAITVLDIILFLILFFMIIVINIFDSYSIFIVNSFIVSYNEVFQTIWMAAPSLILFLSNLMPLFHVNFRYFIIALHFLFCIAMTVMSFWFPSGKLMVNSLYASLSISMIISDIFCFTSLQMKWYRYLIFIGCTIVFFFLMNILLKLRVKFILKLKGKGKEKNLDQNELDNNTELLHQPKTSIDVFEELSVSKLLFTLRIAMISKNSIFLEGKLADLIASKVQTNPDKIELSRLICYFPEFHSIVFALLTALKRARFLSLLREFQLFQLRHYETACHQTTRIEEIDGVVYDTKELSYQIRTLWQMLGTKPRIIRNKFNKKIRIIENQNNNFNRNKNSNNANNNNANNEDLQVNNSNTLLSDQFLFGSYYSMSRSISKLENKWNAIIRFYPNNIQVSQEYARFLIECRGDFIKAAEWRTMCSFMKEGKTFYYNPVTISFLKAYPEYAKQLMYSKQSFLSIDDIDFHTKLSNMENYIDMPETRFEYQRATNSSYPISLYIFLAISICSLLFITIYWITGINTFNRYEHISDSLYLIDNTALLSQQISKNFINALMDYGQIPEVDLTPTPSEICNSIYNNKTSDRVDDANSPSFIKLNGEYKSQIIETTELGMNILHFLHNETLNQMYLGNKFQAVSDVFFNNSVNSFYYFSNSDSTESNENLQSLIIAFFAYFFTFSYSPDFEWVNDPMFYHVANAGANALDSFEKLSVAYLDNDQLLISLSNTKFQRTVFIVSIIYFIISVIIMWIDFCYIWNGFHKIVYTLQFFPKTVKLKAASQIIISNSNNANYNDVANSGINSINNNINLDDHADINIHYQIKYTLYIYLVIASIINLLLSFAIVSYYFIAKTYRNHFVSISRLVHYYSLQSSSAIEILFSCMAANMFGQIVPKIDDVYKKRFSNSIEKFIVNHENCGSISIENDCGISGQFADLLNSAQNLEKCPDMPNRTFHEIISCLGTEQELMTIIDLADSLSENLNDPKLLKKETFIQFSHFLLSHVYFDIGSYTNYLQSALKDKMQNHVNLLSLLGGLSILLSVFLFLFNLNVYYKFIGIFRTLFTFFSRLPPPDLVAQDTVLDAFFGIKILNKIDDENNDSSFLVQESLPIAFIDRSTMIELVNSSFSHTFGYEANFIVGQPITTIFDDESALYLIDSMKYFGAKKSASINVKCRKGNGNKVSFNITFIPIKESKTKETNTDSFIHRIALVFIDKTKERSIQHKCKQVKEFNQKLTDLLYPLSFQLFIDGCFNMCSVCILKLQNMFDNENLSARVLTQRQNIYDLLFDKLKIYPLLQLLDCKNGFFIVVGCGSNDPTELAIECLNFVFCVFNEFAIMMSSFNNSLVLPTNGTIFAVIETAGSIKVGWSGEESKKVVISGELIERALKVLDNSCLAGNICVSKKTYEYIMLHDYMFNEKVIDEEICDSKSIFSIDVYQSERSSFARDSQSSADSVNSTASSSGHQLK